MKKAPLESRIVLRVKMMLEARGAFVVKIHGSPLQVAGLPDLMGCYRGYFIGLEVKRPGGEATKLQEFMLEKIRKAGGIAAVVHSVEEAEETLSHLLEDQASI